MDGMEAGDIVRRSRLPGELDIRVYASVKRVRLRYFIRLKLTGVYRRRQGRPFCYLVPTIPGRMKKLLRQVKLNGKAYFEVVRNEYRSFMVETDVRPGQGSGE